MDRSAGKNVALLVLLLAEQNKRLPLSCRPITAIVEVYVVAR